MPSSFRRVAGIRVRAVLACSLTAVGALTFAAVVAGPAAAANPTTRYVATTGSDASDCSTAASPCLTIQHAINVALPGDTISIAAGLYVGNLQIPTALSIDGAYVGVTASAGRTDPSRETIIQGTSTAPVVTYGGGASTGTIDGVTIDGAMQASVGIAAFGSNGDYYNWDNDVIENNATGINFNASGVSGSTTISYDRFYKNVAPGSPSSTGIFMTNGPSNNVTIALNLFQDDGTNPSANGEINTTGSANPAAPSSNITIAGNTEVFDNTPGHDTYENNFGALFNTNGMLVINNQIVDQDPGDTNADSAIYVGGAVYNADITNNTISGGADAAGVNINSDFYDYTGPTNIEVENNVITNRDSGVRLRGDLVFGTHTPPTHVTVRNNVISHSTRYGLWVQTGVSGIDLHGNKATGSGLADCQDETTGSGTAGTADSWTNNIGATSSPAGLCSSPTVLTTQPVTVVGSLLTLKATFSATLTSQLTGQPIAGATVKFSAAKGSITCTGTTNAAGVASCSVNVLSSLVGLLTSSTYTATYAGGTGYLASTGTGAVRLL